MSTPHQHLVGGHGRAHGGRVEVDGRAREDLRAGDRDAHGGRIEVHPRATAVAASIRGEAGRLQHGRVRELCVAQRIRDAAPVGVATVDRGLDEAALDTTARAAARASASSRRPLTWQVIREVAPSPSAACCRASDRHTASTAAEQRSPGCTSPGTRAPHPPHRTRPGIRCRWCTCRRPRTAGSRCAPRSAAASGRASAGDTSASVRTYVSIVAMRGMESCPRPWRRRRP